MTFYLYVTLSEEDKISTYSMDPDSGDLELLRRLDVRGRPAPLAVDPDKRFMYVGRRDLNQIDSYGIDGGSGGLTLLGTAQLDSDPCYMSTDRTGDYLLSAYYNAGRAAVHAIGTDGTVQTPPIEWRATATGAHCMQTDPTNSYVFLPHIAGGNGPNEIFQFRFDSGSGRLSENSPFKLTPEPEMGPRHYCFHPSLDVVYFSNEQGCSVTAYDLDKERGTLTPIHTVPTLPDGYSGRNSCAQIHITPSGRFLYAPNRGHNSIACFAVDPSTGRLERTAVVEAEPVPRAFGIDPTGTFLYSAGLESGRLAAYRIREDGVLDLMRTHDVGRGPMWVLLLEL